MEPQPVYEIAHTALYCSFHTVNHNITFNDWMSSLFKIVGRDTHYAGQSVELYKLTLKELHALLVAATAVMPSSSARCNAVIGLLKEQFKEDRAEKMRESMLSLHATGRIANTPPAKSADNDFDVLWGNEGEIEAGLHAEDGRESAEITDLKETIAHLTRTKNEAIESRDNARKMSEFSLEELHKTNKEYKELCEDRLQVIAELAEARKSLEDLKASIHVEDNDESAEITQLNETIIRLTGERDEAAESHDYARKRLDKVIADVHRTIGERDRATNSHLNAIAEYHKLHKEHENILAELAEARNALEDLDAVAATAANQAEIIADYEAAMAAKNVYIDEQHAKYVGSLAELSNQNTILSADVERLQDEVASLNECIGILLEQKKAGI